MSVAIVTGASGLVGSETARFLQEKGLSVIGIDNHLRGYFFGPEASTRQTTKALLRELPDYRHWEVDIRDQQRMDEIFANYGKEISLVIHAAAQPSHDWAMREPLTDFSVNAAGTLILLEALRHYAPEAVFIFISTNKVYGDAPNHLPLIEQETRWELTPDHPFAANGIDETMSIDQSKHSIFGVSKVSADVMVQEYGRYFGLKTGVFRCGCITGPRHAGAELHGFLSYLVKCTIKKTPYMVYGYKGKQVRDNIHAYDLVNACWHFYQLPRPGAVYNLGGSRHSNCSVVEAIREVEELSGHRLQWALSEQARSGDHLWWISDVRKFQRDYPDWSHRYDHKMILAELIASVLGQQILQSGSPLISLPAAQTEFPPQDQPANHPHP